MSFDITQILLLLISALGTLMMYTLRIIMLNLKELKQEIRVLKHLETRISVLELKIEKN